uniref:Glucose-1-phosphate adenylyltransferase large subunit 1-like n=1 Tax=Rhizophora mucronata TaxID=61149 RepID=A0A2P2JW46_RHIMU
MVRGWSSIPAPPPNMIEATCFRSALLLSYCGASSVMASLPLFDVRTARATPGLTLPAFFSVLKLLANPCTQTSLFRLLMVL